MMRRCRLLARSLSVGLLALILIFWWRSHTLGEIVGREQRDRADKVTRIEGILSGGGQIAWGTLQVQYPTCFGRVEMPPVYDLWIWRREFVPLPFLPETAHWWLTELGFGRRGTQGGNYTRHVFTGVGVPYWLLAMTAGSYPLWIVASTMVCGLRRAGRIELGLCLNCGYDLRASGDRCPECGSAVQAR